ncbi:MAG: hypothetical protein ABL933_06575 [Methyloglobulus sp.]|nr:hypothetical protein [Methyloglobulus sp.]
MKRLFVVVAMLYLIGMSAASAAPYNDGHGHEWRQVAETYYASWADVATVCPRDGLTPCNGSVPAAFGKTYDLTDWIWATDSQSRTLFSYYTPDFLTSDTLSGSTYLQPARNVFNGFSATNSQVCAGGCPVGSYRLFLTGWTSTINATTSLPVSGYVEANNSTIQNGIFTIAGKTDGHSYDTGVFLWRATGQSTGQVHAYYDTGSVANLAGGTAIANVLVNDWNNGVRATTANVLLSTVSSTRLGLTLDPATGAVYADTTVGAGTHDLVYQICSTTNTSCDTATARVTVPNITGIQANADGGTVSTVGGVVVANVLANDMYNYGSATTANTTLTKLSWWVGLDLNEATGEITAAPGMTPGNYYTVEYRICDKLLANNCSRNTVYVTVTNPNIVIQANADIGTVTTSGGVVIANVLANDLYGTVAATTANVSLQTVQVPPGLTLDPLTGAVNIAAGTTRGSYPLSYRICDKLNAANCASAVATATVRANVIDAVNDSGSVKRSTGGVAIANVLANDTLEVAPATTAKVTLSVGGSIPRGFTFSATTGKVSVVSGASTGTYTVNYKICEKAAPTNCDQASAVVKVVR